jgi:hypothetical protein
MAKINRILALHVCEHIIQFKKLPEEKKYHETVCDLGESGWYAILPDDSVVLVKHGYESYKEIKKAESGQ